jgi:hypothetical protein
MRWAVHVAGMGKRKDAYRILVGKSEGKNHLEDLGLDGNIILRWIFRKGGWGLGLDLSGSG